MNVSKALSIVKGVDLTPIVEDQFTNMATYLAEAAKVPVEKVNIYSTYSNGSVQLNYMRPNFNNKLTLDAILTILKPPLILKALKKELAQIVTKQFEYLTDFFAKKEGVLKEEVSIVTQHQEHYSPKVFIAVSGAYKYELSIQEVSQLIHKNF